ncbi:BTB/POZ and TAZ domain-containing protein 4 [Linum perenne]
MVNMSELIADEPNQPTTSTCPPPPVYPCHPITKSDRIIFGQGPAASLASRVSVSRSIRDTWERMFDEGYRSDVQIITSSTSHPIFAHSTVLGMASPVLRGIYENEEMEEYVLHLMVLSHVFMVPQLKQICINRVEMGFLTVDNVVDILQLALLCDAPRLSLVCHRKILNNFREIIRTQGWRVMKESHPVLEKELLESMIEVDSREKDRVRRGNERKMYMQLYEAMEALVHICRDGCKTIGPHDKELERNEQPCRYGGACRGLEQLVRHFAGCKQRVVGGCIHCKRMGQLLELHSRICFDSNICGVPLCRNLKERMKKQSKKDETKWRILVKNIIRAKAIRESSFFLSAVVSSSSTSTSFF